VSFFGAIVTVFKDRSEINLVVVVLLFLCFTRTMPLFNSIASRSLFSSVYTTATREMSKYMSKAAKKRMPLTTKRVRKGFYKGNGATKEGRITSKGKFIVDPLKRVELVVPDLTGFKVSSTRNGKDFVSFVRQLKPYIARSASKIPPEEQRNPRPR